MPKRRLTQVFDQDAVRRLLLERAKPFARQKNSAGLRVWGEAHDIPISRISEFMNSKRGPTTKLLAALGLEYRIIRIQHHGD